MMRATIALAALCVLLPLAGCMSPEDYQSVTEATWTNDVKLIRYEPAWRPNLEIYRASNQTNYLVIYDEQQGNSPAVHRRAYWLDENEKLIAAGLRPNFVVVSNLSALLPVPVQTNRWEEIDVTNIVGLNAVLLSDRMRFVLVSEGKSMGGFYLPVYSKNGSEIFWVARLPAAVAIDVVAFPLDMFYPFVPMLQGLNR